jgi:hypothetical protein
MPYVLSGCAAAALCDSDGKMVMDCSLTLSWRRWMLTPCNRTTVSEASDRERRKYTQ